MPGADDTVSGSETQRVQTPCPCGECRLASVSGLGDVVVQTGDFAAPTRALLCSRQEDRLSTRLRRSKAKRKFVGHGVMFPT